MLSSFKTAVLEQNLDLGFFRFFMIIMKIFLYYALLIMFSEKFQNMSPMKFNVSVSYDIRWTLFYFLYPGCSSWEYFSLFFFWTFYFSNGVGQFYSKTAQLNVFVVTVWCLVWHLDIHSKCIKRIISQKSIWFRNWSFVKRYQW